MSEAAQSTSELSIPALRAGLASIEKYLFTNGKSRELAARAIVAMRSVAERMVSGTYPFVATESLDLTEIGTLMSKATLSEDVAKPAVTLSLTVPEGMGYGGWLMDVWEPMHKQLIAEEIDPKVGYSGKELHSFLSDGSFQWFRVRLSAKIGTEKANALIKAWRTHFAGCLPFAAWRESAFPFDEDSGSSPRHVLEANLSFPLMLLGLYALAGTEARFATMETLVEVLQQCIPIGVNANYEWILAVGEIP